MDDLISNVKKYLKIINKNVEDSELIDFVIGEVIDRVKIYLNSETLPKHLDRILANIIDKSLKKARKEKELSEENDTNQAINSISDNGQSISYSNEIVKYFTTVSDEELFTGFSSLLSRYRRVKVVYPKNDDE